MVGLAFKFGFVGGDAASLTLPFGEGGTAERWVRIELKTNCVSTVFTSSTTFGGPPSPKGKVWGRVGFASPLNCNLKQQPNHPPRNPPSFFLIFLYFSRLLCYNKEECGHPFEHARKMEVTVT